MRFALSAFSTANFSLFWLGPLVTGEAITLIDPVTGVSSAIGFLSRRIHQSASVVAG